MSPVLHPGVTLELPFHPPRAYDKLRLDPVAPQEPVDDERSLQAVGLQHVAPCDCLGEVRHALPIW